MAYMSEAESLKENPVTYDIIGHLARQAAFSRATFGPGPRTEGVSDHIKKELKEIATADGDIERSDEWVDVAILGLDGLLRSLWVRFPHESSDQIAARAMEMIRAKQGKNERRNWPDWRTAPTGKAIEHVRGTED